ncbi:hypothetical protein L3Q82_002048 [Scortum barcoo]|uniref:Uncharacterized protein n=1 Tax=Scortum barcoo TaxID=214431 RepID=A0ACB8W1F1_9TELE|nr:hypothetical protein L3Q82_002048 [Scortum barcoo]
MWKPVASPKTVIQGHSHLVPGHCWCFAGGQGQLFIALSHRVTVSHVTLTHISKNVSPTGEISSAPNVFSVYGMENVNDEGTMLGTFIYDQDGDQVQTFKLPAWAGGPAGRKIVRCLLDGGSQRSFIHEDVAKALRLPVIRQETLNLHTFGSTTPATVQRNIVKVWMENVWDSQQRIEIEAVETPQVCSAVIKVPGKPLQEELERKGLQLADFSLDGSDDPELSVLIGGDFYWQVVSGKVQRLTYSLVAIESSFGWALQGPVSTSSVTDATCMHISLEEDTQIAKQLHAFWEVESLGIVHEKAKSPEETEALQNFEQTVTHNNGRYQVELPWRPDKPDLPDNFRVAKGRFEGLKRRLKTDTTLYKGYSDVIKDYLQQGICEDVPANTLQQENPESVKDYMPHHAVLRKDKITTKLRVVFDASSHEDGSSIAQ